MKQLKTLFGAEEIKKLEALPGQVKEILCENYGVSNIGDLPDEGYVFILVELDKDISVDRVKSIVADTMGIDVETVDVDDNEFGRVIGEMSLGSHLMPWPLFAMKLLESVSEQIEKLGLQASISF